jgi:hypothetical protein
VKIRTFFKTLAALSTLVLAIGTVCLFIFRPSADRVRSEKYAVYSAYLDSKLTGLSHDLGSPEGLSVIVGVTMAPSVATRTNMKHNLPFIRSSTLRNFTLCNLQDERLTRDFQISAKYVLITKEEARQANTVDFLHKYPGSYGYVTLSKVGFNTDLTEAPFYSEHICGLCGGGEYVLMQKIDAHWKIVGESFTWVS